MTSFVVFKKIPVKEIRNGGKDLTKKCEEFFKNNPKRRVANVQVWYQKVVKIRKAQIKEDVAAAVEEALGKTK